MTKNFGLERPPPRRPYVGGHVTKEVRETFVEEASELGISQSQLLSMILADYLGIEPMPPEYDTRNGKNVKVGGTTES